MLDKHQSKSGPENTLEAGEPAVFDEGEEVAEQAQAQAWGWQASDTNQDEKPGAVLPTRTAGWSLHEERKATPMGQVTNGCPGKSSQATGQSRLWAGVREHTRGAASRPERGWGMRGGEVGHARTCLSESCAQGMRQTALL